MLNIDCGCVLFIIIIVVVIITYRLRVGSCVMLATMVKGQVAIEQETFWRWVGRLPQPQLKMTAALQLCDPVL